MSEIIQLHNVTQTRYYSDQKLIEGEQEQREQREKKRLLLVSCTISRDNM